jgi:hypothetical protein
MRLLVVWLSLAGGGLASSWVSLVSRVSNLLVSKYRLSTVFLRNETNESV